MHTFRKKNAFLKIQLPIKGKMNLNLYEKINLYHWCELTMHTEYEEYQKLQLSTVVRYQHNNTLGKI